MTTALPPELESFVERKVASGTFRDRDEVVCEALRLMAQDDLRNDDIDRALAESEEDFARGNYTTYRHDEIGKLFDEIRDEVALEKAWRCIVCASTARPRRHLQVHPRTSGRTSGGALSGDGRRYVP